MILHQDTITLFNREENRAGDIWHPTVIRNVHLTTDRSTLIAKYGPETNDTAALNIHCQVIDGAVRIGTKQWLPPKEWANKADYDNTITFAEGTTFDFFFKGEWDESAVIRDADYLGGFYAYMNREHDYVFAVTAVGGPYKLIPHFEIMGK